MKNWLEGLEHKLKKKNRKTLNRKKWSKNSTKTIAKLQKLKKEKLKVLHRY